MTSLQDFAKKIEVYETLRTEILNLRRNIPLNLINLDCSHLNDVMRKVLMELIEYITNYFMDVNRENNRE